MGNQAAHRQPPRGGVDVRIDDLLINHVEEIVRGDRGREALDAVEGGVTGRGRRLRRGPEISHPEQPEAGIGAAIDQPPEIAQPEHDPKSAEPQSPQDEPARKVRGLSSVARFDHPSVRPSGDEPSARVDWEDRRRGRPPGQALRIRGIHGDRSEP